jgi:hypothetical protein
VRQNGSLRGGGGGRAVFTFVIVTSLHSQAVLNDPVALWVCSGAGCTMQNPNRADKCVVCATPNPRPIPKSARWKCACGYTNEAAALCIECEAPSPFLDDTAKSTSSCPNPPAQSLGWFTSPRCIGPLPRHCPDAPKSRQSTCRRAKHTTAGYTCTTCNVHPRGPRHDCQAR